MYQEAAPTQKGVIEVRADQQTRPVSRLLTGVCLEDVNHEVYGGLYSQMVFGESFQAPELATDQVKGFRALGGQWMARDGELMGTGAPGNKVVSALNAFTDGEAGVEVYVPDRKRTNAGLIVRVGNAHRPGADNFNGYEIALNAEKQSLMLGRHRQNFALLKNAPCDVPTGAWVVELAGPMTATNTAGRPRAIVPQERRWEHGLKEGKAAHMFAPHSVTITTWE